MWKCVNSCLFISLWGGDDLSNPMSFILKYWTKIYFKPSLDPDALSVNLLSRTKADNSPPLIISSTESSILMSVSHWGCDTRQKNYKRRTGGEHIWKRFIELFWELWAAFTAQVGAPCCTQRKTWMSEKGKKGILMASFDSWQDSGLTPAPPLIGCWDPGAPLFRRLGSGTLAKSETMRVIWQSGVCVVCKCCKTEGGGTGTTFIHIHLVFCHEQRQHKGLIEGPFWRGIMVMGT